LPLKYAKVKNYKNQALRLLLIKNLPREGWPISALTRKIFCVQVPKSRQKKVNLWYPKAAAR
jgi:hypothetical protein